MAALDVGHEYFFLSGRQRYTLFYRLGELYWGNDIDSLNVALARDFVPPRFRLSCLVARLQFQFCAVGI